MFTLFHLLQIIGLVAGLVGGIYVGSNNFGWLGGVIGAILGVIVGFVIGKVPFLVSFALLRHDFSRDDAETLKQRLKKEYYISHLIIAELVQRGEPAEQFRGYFLSQLQSEHSDERRFGWNNLNLWFPELAKQLEPFDTENPTNENKTKLLSLERAT